MVMVVTVVVVVVLMALVPPVVELNQEEEEETKREENHPIPCQVLIIDHSEGTRHICSPHSSTCRNYDELHDDERSRRQWGANVWVLGASSLLTFITFIT